MTEHDACEQAYKNGYEQGKKDAVVYGSWSYRVDHYEDVIISKCSVCHAEGPFTQLRGKFCPNCGANMGGKPNA